MRTAPILVLSFVLSLVTAAPSGAQSGTQLTPDGKRALVSKDIGGQRWAISRNPDHTVTGNVFFPGGGAPQFVFCTETGASDSDVTLSCSGADACPLSMCEPDEWLFIADVTLPLSFFGSTSGGVASTAAQAAGVAPSAAKTLASVGRAAGAPGEAQPSGIQITPNSALALISKDVGDQRWAITRNDDGTVTGNVFFPGGGAPQFVWCEPTGTAADPVALRCLGAAACDAGEGGCASSDWTLIAEVSLPASFFRARDTVSLEGIAITLSAAYGEEAAFERVVLALDRGYALRQIARAALSDRLQPDGTIVERAGGLEPPAGPAAGLFVDSPASALERPAAAGVTIAALLAEFRGEDFGFAIVALVLKLAESGYSLPQIVTELLLSNSTLIAADRRRIVIRGADGLVVVPDFIRQGVDDAPSSSCGNGVRDPLETCDGNDLGLFSECDDYRSGSTGELRCGTDCDIDLSGCSAPAACGNGKLDGGEDCEGTNFRGESCSSQGYAGGALACDNFCTFDTGACFGCATGVGGCCPSGSKPCNGTCVPSAAVCCAPGTDQCGNGCIPDGADCCAGGLFCEVGRICVAEGCCPAGFPQVCNGQCFAAGTSCCGNGVREAGEACDGADVGGTTCPELGSVRCTSSCTLDTSGCEARCPAGAFTCGNSCAPDGAECCPGTSLFCDGGDTCADGVCCPAGFPTFCAGTCYPTGVVCCGSYACAAGSTCLGNNQCG